MKDTADFGTLFIIADAGCTTGFAKVTHSFIKHLSQHWNIHVLAINYNGDYHPISEYCRLYNPQAKVSGDYYGYSRVKSLLSGISPDMIFMINDAWVITEYLRVIGDTEIPIAFYTPVDAVNIKPMYIEPLNKANIGIAYTAFGSKVLIDGGYRKPLHILPHGVDTDVFYPIADAKQLIVDNKLVDNLSIDDFVVQVVDRNSQRKRLDLALYGFALWAAHKPTNVKLWYHGALKDEGYDVAQLADYFGISDRMIYTALNLDPGNGVTDDVLNAVYNAADIKVSTSGGEGFGLTAMESMATHTANMAVNTAAISEWANGGVHYIRPSNIPLVSTRGLNTIQAQADIDSYIEGLERLYTDTSYRDYIANSGYGLVTQSKYQWSIIADRLHRIFKDYIDDEHRKEN
jgi:D-inositol-3-phosphate glycosyltransferase